MVLSFKYIIIMNTCFIYVPIITKFILITEYNKNQNNRINLINLLLIIAKQEINMSSFIKVHNERSYYFILKVAGGAPFCTLR